MALALTCDERTELEARVRSRRIRSEAAQRARVILMLANGDSYSMIETALSCYRDYINRWRRRSLAKRLAGLESRHYSQPPSKARARHRLLAQILPQDMRLNPLHQGRVSPREAARQMVLAYRSYLLIP